MSLCLEAENRRLKQMVVEQSLDIQVLKVITSKKLVTPRAKRIAATFLVTGFELSHQRVSR